MSVIFEDILQPLHKAYARGIGRGLKASGSTNKNDYNRIDCISIDSKGNASDFGDLWDTIYGCGVCSSMVRGIFGGGRNKGDSVNYNDIRFVTIATMGNTADFGDLTTSDYYRGAFSNEIRGVFTNGTNTSWYWHFITIASSGNAASFGNDTLSRRQGAVASNSYRGLCAGDESDDPHNNITCVTIMTAANTADFGDLLATYIGCLQGLSNKTRACFAGGLYSGHGYSATIQFATINTMGNCASFGSLTESRRMGCGGAASESRGCFMGGYGDDKDTVTIDFITIPSAGNAADFGDLTLAADYYSGMGCSDVHGGLQ